MLTLYILIAYGVYFSFFFMIVLFGNAISHFLFRKLKKNGQLTFLENLFISYGIGLSFYIQYSYILNFFKLFKFIYVYLPILLFILLYILIFIMTNNFKAQLNKMKKKLINNREEYFINSLIVLIPIFFEFYLFIPILTQSSAFLAWDPYLYVQTTWFLKNNGFINFPYQAIYYPWGYNFILGGHVLPHSNFIVLYSLLKFGCLPQVNIYVLIFYCLSKRFLKWKSLILMSLISIFLNSFFLTRALLFLSSSFSIIVILISFIIILTNANNILLGMTIPTMFLINPMYALFFLIIFFGFYFISLFYRSFKKIEIIRELFLIIIEIPIFIVIYIISVYYFYNRELDELLKNYFEIFNGVSNSPLTKIPQGCYKCLFLLFLFNIPTFLETITLQLRQMTFHDIIFSIIEFLSFFGVFLKIENGDKNQINFFNAMKLGTLIFLSGHLYLLFHDLVQVSILFYNRVLEIFSPCIILLYLLYIKRSFILFQNRKNSKEFNNFMSFLFFIFRRRDVNHL